MLWQLSRCKLPHKDAQIYMTQMMHASPLDPQIGHISVKK